MHLFSDFLLLKMSRKLCITFSFHYIFSLFVSVYHTEPLFSKSTFVAVVSEHVEMLKGCEYFCKALKIPTSLSKNTCLIMNFMRMHTCLLYVLDWHVLTLCHSLGWRCHETPYFSCNHYPNMFRFLFYFLVNEWH